jgi:hypothetical protein
MVACMLVISSAIFNIKSTIAYAVVVKYLMPIFKTTEELLELSWDLPSPATTIPLKEEWLINRLARIDDIDLWEEIYHQPGNIGIYAAWSPYTELYIIVHSLLHEVEEYHLSTDAKLRMEEFGVVLSENRIWV